METILSCCKRPASSDEPPSSSSNAPSGCARLSPSYSMVNYETAGRTGWKLLCRSEDSGLALFPGSPCFPSTLTIVSAAVSYLTRWRRRRFLWQGRWRWIVRLLTRSGWSLPWSDCWTSDCRGSTDLWERRHGSATMTTAAAFVYSCWFKHQRLWPVQPKLEKANFSFYDDEMDVSATPVIGRRRIEDWNRWLVLRVSPLFALPSVCDCLDLCWWYLWCLTGGSSLWWCLLCSRSCTWSGSLLWPSCSPANFLQPLVSRPWKTTGTYLPNQPPHALCREIYYQHLALCFVLRWLHF